MYLEVAWWISDSWISREDDKNSMEERTGNRRSLPATSLSEPDVDALSSRVTKNNKKQHLKRQKRAHPQKTRHLYFKSKWDIWVLIQESLNVKNNEKN